MAGFEIMDHTADVGIAVWGDSLEEVFVTAARGMFSLITDIETIDKAVSYEVQLEASDREELLVVWLNELLYLLDTENVIFGDFEIITVTEVSLTAKALGDKLDLARHTIKTQIKAATYHMLKIEPSEGHFRAQVILDI